MVDRYALTTDQFTVRVVGSTFAIVSTFNHLARPEQLAAFVERVRRDHGQ